MLVVVERGIALPTEVLGASTEPIRSARDPNRTDETDGSELALGPALCVATVVGGPLDGWLGSPALLIRAAI